jgi:hypothetical protein
VAAVWLTTGLGLGKLGYLEISKPLVPPNADKRLNLEGSKLTSRRSISIGIRISIKAGQSLVF